MHHSVNAAARATVPKQADRLEHVRKSAVTYIVQKRGDTDGRLVLAGDLVFVIELCKDACREMKCTEAVREARVLRALVSKVSQSQLPNAPQALKLS